MGCCGIFRSLSDFVDLFPSHQHEANSIALELENTAYQRDGGGDVRRKAKQEAWITGPDHHHRNQ